MEFQIYDEKGAVCKGKETGLYYQKKYHQADSEGKILVEFSDDHQSGYLILKHDQFSQFRGMVSIEPKRVEFSQEIYFNEETLLPGNNATFLLSTHASSSYS